MRRAALVLAAMLAGASASADGFSPPSLDAFAKAADLASLQALVPVPCNAVPSGDTLNGTVGATTCFVPRDAARPTAVQGGTVTSDGSGNWSITFGRSFVSASPIINAIPINNGSLPMICNVASRSATSATGKCWQSNSVTLGGSLTALLGLIINAFTNGASGAAVMVIAREPTQ